MRLTIAVFLLLVAIGCACSGGSGDTNSAGGGSEYFEQLGNVNLTEAARLGARPGHLVRDGPMSQQEFQRGISAELNAYADDLAALAPPSELAGTHARLIEHVRHVATNLLISAELTATPSAALQHELFRGTDAAWKSIYPLCQDLQERAGDSTKLHCSESTGHGMK